MTLFSPTPPPPRPYQKTTENKTAELTEMEVTEERSGLLIAPLHFVGETVKKVFSTLQQAR